MNSTGRNWLIGCGVGCGFLLLLGIGLGTLGWFGVRHVTDRVERVESVSAALAERFGDPATYTPPPDGRLAPDRLEAFLEVRRLMTPARERTARDFAVLDGSSAQGGVAAKIKAGINFVPSVLGFVEGRNSALMDVGMGPGEYQYIYTVAYFGLLDKDPGDGPGFAVTTDGGGGGSSRWSMDSHGDSNAGEVGEDRAREVRDFLNRVQRQNLNNQLTALDAGGLATAGLKTWRAALAAEVDAMNRERRRHAWEEGLPPQILDSLEPFRDRLDATYDGMTGILELGLVEDD